jgi:hypothetical protein
MKARWISKEAGARMVLREKADGSLVILGWHVLVV